MSFQRMSGFSLIELMIVVSIISILVAIGIPSYQQYIKKARFTDIITNTQAFKLAVALAIQQNVPLTELVNGKHGIPASPKNKNIDSIKVTKGVITATGSELLDHETYILTPDVEASVWSQSGTCVASGLCNG